MYARWFVDPHQRSYGQNRTSITTTITFAIPLLLLPLTYGQEKTPISDHMMASTSRTSITICSANFAHNGGYPHDIYYYYYYCYFFFGRWTRLATMTSRSVVHRYP